MRKCVDPFCPVTHSCLCDFSNRHYKLYFIDGTVLSLQKLQEFTYFFKQKVKNVSVICMTGNALNMPSCSYVM